MGFTATNGLKLRLGEKRVANRLQPYGLTMTKGNRDKGRAMGSVGLACACRGQLPAPVFFEPLGCQADAVLQGKGAGTKNPESLTHIDRIVGGHTLHAG